MSLDLIAEWLESDGIGGYASGTAGGARTRRYHALLLSATAPPAGRVVLVNGLEAWLTTDSGRVPISTQHYAPDVIHPDGYRHITSFEANPWPTWTFDAGGGVAVTQEILVDRAGCETVVRWRRVAGKGVCALEVRPLLSGRDIHSLHHENPAFDFSSSVVGGNVVWRPYAGLPAVTALTNGAWRAAPDWFRRFLYVAEQARGLDDEEDLGSPGIFAWDLARGPAVMVLRAGDSPLASAVAHADELIAAERARRAGFATALSRAADSYLVDRGSGRTVLAGFPWFSDWGRDTFIALRGLAIGTGRLDDAEAILTAWSGAVSEGMLPNRFPDHGDTPEYNAVDASLWFVVAVHDFLCAAAATGRNVDAATRAALDGAIGAILRGYHDGTRFGIRCDADGLLAAGVPGVQLTWMDAKVGDWVVTPRIGKPVEIQALWINALRIAGGEWSVLAKRATASFQARFPDPRTGGLADVVDADHVAGRVDARVRPNQIFAVGGLPFPVLEGGIAKRIVDLAEQVLLTPMGLRSLAPDDPDYAPHYRGGPRERDGAYHQGTVWPWLIGPFVEAWLRVNGRTPTRREEARRRFIAPLQASMDRYGIGHICEVADGEAPHAPGGCPFQAWSVGELIRAERLLADDAPEGFA
jgi:predicted glycogen debranching enzyme